jgi:hypothetical protein
MTDLTPDEIAAGLELAEKATPGPWETDDRLGLITVNEIDIDGEGDRQIILPYDEHDSAFIAASRELLPRALSQLQRQAERIAALEAHNAWLMKVEEAARKVDQWDWAKVTIQDSDRDEMVAVFDALCATLEGK